MSFLRRLFRLPCEAQVYVNPELLPFDQPCLFCGVDISYHESKPSMSVDRGKFWLVQVDEHGYMKVARSETMPL